MEISFLPADEIERIRPLWEQLNRTHLRKSNNWKEHFSELIFQQRIQKIVRANNYRIIVSSQENEITGYCMASISNNIGEIDSIFVVEKARDASVGHQLMEKAIEWLKSEKVEYIEVGVAEGNESVVPFYERFGFKKSMTLLKKV